MRPILRGHDGKGGSRRGDCALEIFEVARFIIVVGQYDGCLTLESVTPFLIGVLRGKTTQQYGRIQRIVPHLLAEQKIVEHLCAAPKVFRLLRQMREGSIAVRA